MASRCYRSCSLTSSRSPRLSAAPSFTPPPARDHDRDRILPHQTCLRLRTNNPSAIALRATCQTRDLRTLSDGEEKGEADRQSRGST
ncbi:hypothetical protein VE03_10548, partial [Pseudogymnoascus sp. 23342-1-I1]